MPEVAKPIIAFREWLVDDDRLAPRFQFAAGGHNPWSQPRGTVEAKCKKYGKSRRHVGGTKNCTCGLYGFYGIPVAYQSPILDHGEEDEDGRLKEALRLINLDRSEQVVFGAFIGFGKTSHHVKGIRSQKARVVALRWSPAAERVAALYELPLCDTTAELKAAAMKWGELVDPPPIPPNAEAMEALTRAARAMGPAMSGIAAGYRTAAQQAALAAQNLSGITVMPLVSVVLSLTLHSGVEVTVEAPEGARRGRGMMEGRQMSIKGLDGRVWTINKTETDIPRMEVPLVGRTMMGTRPGAAMVTVELETRLPLNLLDKEMGELTKIGTVRDVKRSQRW